MLRFAVAASAALLLAAPSLAQATFLNAGIAGTLTTSQQNPVPGSQTFTLTGGFTSYAASSNLPQNVGNDLPAYSFTVTGLSQAYDTATRTVTYGNVTGTINGYGQVVQYLSPTTLTVAFDPTFTTASILGTLMSPGAVTPPGFPGPVNFAPANGAVIAGLYTTNGTQGGSVRGTIIFPSATAAVPEPATWAMMLAGFGTIGVAMRRRKIVASFA